jgi:uncharacterized protein
LLEVLSRLRPELKPTQTVLRTNLAYSLTPELIRRLAHSTDQLVVSVDGDEASHDTRRGSETYARTVENLRILLTVSSTTQVSIAAVLSAEEIGGAQGEAVRALGEELGVKVRFKSLLPLGRGLDLGLRPAYYNSLDDSTEVLAASLGPTATCGLGMNLYIGPHGECYPCYALMGSSHLLGNALEEDMSEVLKQNNRYRWATVDSNELCHACALRYLCGGFCRAWSKDGSPDAAPVDCTALYMRAQELLIGALETLEKTPVDWQMAGLPLPDVFEFGQDDHKPTG